MRELARIIDFKPPRTGVVIRRHKGGGLDVKWHNGEHEQLTAENLRERYRSGPRYEVSPVKAHRGFRLPTQH